jgi:hypothetical protein
MSTFTDLPASERRRIFRKIWRRQEPATQDFLERLGNGVEFDSRKNRLVLTGQKIDRTVRQNRLVRARNVTARRAKGFLVSAIEDWPTGSRLPIEVFAEVTFEQQSDQIVSAEHAR